MKELAIQGIEIISIKYIDFRYLGSLKGSVLSFKGLCLQ